MKKIFFLLFVVMISISSGAQITVTIGNALLTEPGTEIHLPVTVTGLDGNAGGTQVTAIELHILYSNSNLAYDTTLNFCEIASSPQWIFSGNGVEYATNWVEPNLNAISFPDNTVLFDVVFNYLGGSTELDFDESRCLFLNSNYEIIPNVQYFNGQVTPSQGSVASRWNGTGQWTNSANWSNGIPGENTDAVIETGEVNIASNASCKSVTINNGSIANIYPNNSLTVNNNFTNNGHFRIKSDETGSGYFICLGSTDGTGTNNIEQYFDFSNSPQYWVASPVSNATTSVFGNNILERYLENSASWNALASNDNLEDAISYRVSGSNDTTCLFVGNIHNEDITINSLSFENNQDNSLKGLNMIGNPYPCSINWNTGSWIKNNIDQSIYTWDGYKYISWNGITGSLTNGIVPSIKGFMVRANANSSSITIPKDARVLTEQKFNNNDNEVPNVMVMKLENTTDNTHYDEAYINVNSSSSVNFDTQYDAFKYFGMDDYPQIYTKSDDGSNLSINTIPGFQSVPVEVKISNAGSYKITFSNIETFDANQPLFFKDTKTNTAINIRNTNNYLFISDGGQESGRFVLYFQTLGIDEYNKIFSAWIADHELYISSENNFNDINSIELYNISGQLVFSSGKMQIPGNIQLNNALNGIYLLRILYKDNVYLQKVIIR